MSVSRRTVLGAAGAAGLLTATGGYRALGGDTAEAAAAAALPLPQDSGIEHVVVLMMENRSFDHFLGWLPSVTGFETTDGKQAGLVYRDRYGVRHRTHHLEVMASCGFSDPDHSFEGGRIELNGGMCNGWLRAGTNDSLCIGYYERADLPFLGRAATDWTTFDRYFAAVMAETYPNRFYMHCAQTDRLHNGSGFHPADMPTIWDRLKAKGRTGTYYFSDIPFSALLGSHAPLSLPVLPDARFPSSFFEDAAAGTLPDVSFVDPRFVDEGQGTSDDDHPHADIRAGEDFMNQVYDAVRTSPAWDSTVLVITYDEWGGFFDHVAPGHAADVSRTTSLRGFRVPTVVISPFARRGFVSHKTFDHTSVLRMIEWRFGLRPLTPRDKYAHNLASVLDFANPVTTSPTYDVPAFTSPGCGAAGADGAVGAERHEWGALKQHLLAGGWKLPA